MKRKARELFGGDGDAAFGDAVFNSVLANIIGVQSGYTSTDGDTGDYGSAWIVERDWDHRTSLITDPPDGRLPPMTAGGLKRRAASEAALNGVPSGPEARRVWSPATRVPTKSCSRPTPSPSRSR